MKPSDQSYACGIMDRNNKTMTKEEYDSIMNQLNHCKKENIELKKENAKIYAENDRLFEKLDYVGRELEEMRWMRDNYAKRESEETPRLLKELDQMKMQMRTKDALITELNEDRQLFAEELEAMVIEKQELIKPSKVDAIQEPVKEVKKDNGTQGFGQIVALHWMYSVYCWIILSLASIGDSSDYGYSLDNAKDVRIAKNKRFEKEKNKDKSSKEKDEGLIWKQDQMNEKEENVQTIGKELCSNDLANYYLAIIISKNEGRMMHKWNRSRMCSCIGMDFY